MASTEYSCVEITEAMDCPAVDLCYCGLKARRRLMTQLGREEKGMSHDKYDLGFKHNQILKLLKSVNMVL